jgi:cell division protein FtsL
VRPERPKGPARPERPEGPARPQRLERGVRARRGEPASPIARAICGVLDHGLLDRLIRGRIWIAFVAFALIGIVATQLAQLPLSTAIDRTLAHEQQLTQQNSTLRLEVSALSSADRIEALASRLGMVPTAPGVIRFLDAARPPSAAAVERALTPTVSQTAQTAAAGNR